jgi:hypothetical protein
MYHSDFAKLYDRSTRLTCNFVRVGAETRKLVESVRDVFINSMNNFGYVGFSREIDDAFHNRSTYVYVTESTDIVMTCRITPRPLGTIVPFEMGIRDSGGSYLLNEDESVVDINTYTYVRGYYERAMPLLTSGLAYCTKEYEAKKAYCLYDVANQKINRAYTSIGFVNSKRFPELIHFPTFCRQVEGYLIPVRWQVMEWDRQIIEHYFHTALECFDLVNADPCGNPC